MKTEFIITSIFSILSIAINIYQVHREDKIKGKIKSWLEMARGIHSVSQNEGQESICRQTNAMLKDLEDELNDNKIWLPASFVIFILTLAIIIGMIIFKN